MNPLEVPTFGHPFYLGMFYDTRYHSRIRNPPNLGDLVDISNLVYQTKDSSTSINVTGSTLISQKLSDFGADNESALTVLTGLCTPVGSALWIVENDMDWLHEVRCTLHYRHYTHLEGLKEPGLHLDDVCFPDDFDKDAATHLVVGLTYGIDIFTDFTVRCCDNKETGKTRVQLKKLVGRIKNFLEGGQNNVIDYLNSVPWKDDLRIGFFGDLQPKQPVQNVDGCIAFHQNIPTILKINGGHVPLFAWIKPLRQIVVDSNICKETVEVIRELEDISSTLRQLKNLPVCGKMKMSSSSDDFLVLFDAYCEDFKARVKFVLPDVRGGHSPKELESILQKHYRSSFSKVKLMKYWRTKMEEEEALASRFGTLFDLKIYSSDDSNEMESDDGINYLVFLRLYSRMFKYDFAGVADEQTNPTLWFQCSDLLDKLDNTIKHFKIIRGLACLNEAVDFKISWSAEIGSGVPAEVIAYCLKPSASLNLSTWIPWWRDVKVKRKIRNSMLVSWKFPKEIDFVDRFVLKWKENGIEKKTWESSEIEKKVRKHVISNLTVGKEFDISVTCIDVFGQYHNAQMLRVLMKGFSLESRKLSETVLSVVDMAEVELKTEPSEPVSEEDWDKISLDAEPVRERLL